ncbi:hypothetical protein SAMN02745866_01203 [Alteromonadaceae bacterium Bs31]|nr:hypothetical protein SAMN02745866_01203 [Alteromonadaceae bacterium Bs31]
MNKYLVSVLVIFLSIFSAALTYYHYIHTGDTVANYVGYFVSLVVLPILWAVIPALVIITIKFSALTNMQKWLLILFPLILQLILVGGTFWVLQYAQH